MLRRRRDRESSAIRQAFRETSGHVDAARRILVSAAPAGRGAGTALAEALAGFDAELEEAARTMPVWRRPDLEPEWLACGASLDEARHRAEAFRLGQAPEGYEQLYGALADIMEPLEVFGIAGGRIRRARG